MLKSTLDKILANEELRSMITAIGPYISLSQSYCWNSETEENDDASKKIKNIMTDADVDGAHIRTLLLTFF